jgi:predicted nucleic acid-binding protein
VSAVAVDASVWVAAAEASDRFNPQSRAFLTRSVQRGVRLVIPTFALVEVACALARRRGEAGPARQLTRLMLAPSRVEHIPVEADLVQRALQLGPESGLRGADALYVAAAQRTGATLVSWDRELIERAGAQTPAAWLAANA